MTIRNQIVRCLALGLVCVLAAGFVALAQEEPQKNDQTAEAPKVYTNAALEGLSGPSGDTYTNDALQGLPEPENTTWATTDLPPAETTDAVGEKDEKGSTADDEKALEWLDQRAGQVEMQRKIAEAERRVRQAEQKLQRLGGDFRAPGDVAGNSQPETTNEMYSRGVADEETPLKLDRRKAGEELEAARVELAGLLEESNRSGDREE